MAHNKECTQYAITTEEKKNDNPRMGAGGAGISAT